MISHFNKKLQDANEDRRELLEKTFNTDTLDTDDALLMSDAHSNIIYFKDQAYEFIGNEFIRKRDLTEHEKEKLKEEQEKEKEEQEKLENK